MKRKNYLVLLIIGACMASLSPPIIYGQQLELVETYQITLNSLTLANSSQATFDSG
jgi:hypothetical protein